ncbi:MAG: hypothetical protein CMB02_05905 [Euryarchaeota archaeon]|nr:hypothetical protein [Euryarchaeota archaeon]
MGNRKGAIFLVALVICSLISPLNAGDSAISSEEVEILSAGEFGDSSEWVFSSTTGFTQNKAEFTRGIVADGEMSFTHDRPGNFEDHTAWASSGCDDCNATFGESDGYYSWSKGPDITMGGYSFPGLSSMDIEGVSLVIYFSIPDALPSDEVNILLQNHGSDILVSTFARTLSSVNWMNEPLVLPLDQYIEWDWSKLEQTQFTVDYVSDNQGADDSEVRVDAVGLRVRHNQPWYSFENSKAEHKKILVNSPVIDFGPYDGQISGFTISSCGLIPEEDKDSVWLFYVDSVPGQELGRIHIFGSGNHTVSTSTEGPDGIFSEILPGERLDEPNSSHYVKVQADDGCIQGARIDVNDPQLVVNGRVSGGFDGLSISSSYIGFAVGDSLVHSEQMDEGSFSFSVPVGHLLPYSGETLEIGVGTRFQWSSNGSPEVTVVHISSISITGGFTIEWDRDPVCNDVEDLYLIEDGGGEIIEFSSRCTDDLTSSESLSVKAEISDDSLANVSGDRSMLIIEPIGEANGIAEINVQISDDSGNIWADSFTLVVESIPDSPEIIWFPSSTFIELGDSKEIFIEVEDPDSESLIFSSSKSWAVVNGGGFLTITPVEPGTHELTISVSDGTSLVSRNMEIIVTSNPDLTLETMEIRIGGVAVDDASPGDVIELVGFVRNQGRGAAENVTFHCIYDGILVGTGAIVDMGPGDLRMAICDIQITDSTGELKFEIKIDGANTLEESNEENNIGEVDIVIGEEDGSGGSNARSIVILFSILAIIGAISLSLMGPKPVKKEFERRK